MHLMVCLVTSVPSKTADTLLSDPVNQTGYLDGQYSATTQPQADPEIAGQMAFDRIQQVAMGGQYAGLNDRNSIYGA